LKKILAFLLTVALVAVVAIPQAVVSLLRISTMVRHFRKQ